MASKTIQTILNLKDKYSAGMKRAAGNTKEAQRAVKLLHNNVNAFKSSAVSSFASVAKGASGLALALSGIAVAGSLAGAINTAKEYATAMNQLQSSTGATTGEMTAMKKEITDLYKQNFGENWTDLADSMAVARQVTGQAGESLKETTKNALIYRDVFKADIPESIKATDTMMKNFGITSTQAYSLLAQGAQNGLDKSGELLDSANEYSVYFKTLGFSANEMFDIFGAGLKSGAFNLDKVGDSVKEFGIRIKDNSDGSKEALAALGFNANKMMQTFAKGGPEAQKSFKTVVDAISKVKDPIAKNTIGVQLFGTQFEDMEKNVIAAMGTAQSQFDMTKNSMEEINKVKYNDVGAAFEGIKRNIEVGVLNPIADRLLPKMNEFAGWVTTHMPEIQQNIDKAFSAGGKVIDGFAASIQLVKDNANWLIPTIAGLTGAILAQQAIEGITKLYKAWTMASTGLTTAQTLLNLVMAANPFGLIAIAIGALIAGGVLLYKNWDTVSAKASEIWKLIKEKFAEGVNHVVDKINWLTEKLNKIPGVNIPIIAKMSVDDGSAPTTFRNFSLPSAPKTLPQFATGTQFFKGGLARTDEHGGEIKEYPNGTKVIPHDLSKQMLQRQGGGITVNLTVEGNVIGDAKFANQIGDFLYSKIMLAHGNL